MRRICRRVLAWALSFHPKNRDAPEYPQGWYVWGIRHGPKYRYRRPVLEAVCRLLTGHELSRTEWGWGGGEFLDGHCRWCDKVIHVPREEARFRWPTFNDWGRHVDFGERGSSDDD